MMLNPVEARASSATSSDPITRSFLFLQGCTGPFFRTLGLELKRAGHHICRVNFHGGDVFDWPLPDTRMYRGNRADWPRYFLRLVDEQQVTDLVLFADCRPLHADAIQILKAWRPRVRVHVFEEGYLRPDWITLERDGVNAHSPLMQVRGGFLSQPDALAPCAKVEKVGTAVVPQSLHAIGYFLSSYLTRRFFPHYTHHRQSWAEGEATSWIPRVLGRPFRLRRARAAEQKLFDSGSPFFVLLLQINCDKQVLVHSPIKSMRSLMETVVPSFAAHAPADCKLVVKVHPLNSGLWPHEADLMEIAAAHGISDRVVLLDGTELIPLLERCRGAITINSTAGVSALHRGVPLFAFGDAIYNTAGLTHQGSIDAFWTTPEEPVREHYWAFRRVVERRSQINGGFYTRRGIRLAMPAVLKALDGTATGAAERKRLAAPVMVDSVELDIGVHETLVQRVDGPEG